MAGVRGRRKAGERLDFQIWTNRTFINLRKPSGKPCDVNTDNSMGAFGWADGTIEIWNPTTGANYASWSAHEDGIGAVSFFRTMASGWLPAALGEK